MLLRIAPDMFIDERFECKTIREVHEEIVRTTKFKTKYPWINELRAKVKPIILNEKQKLSESMFFEAINELNYQGTKNLKTGHLFDLSREDIRVISCALTLGYKITSGDRGLVQFAYQEFKDDFKGNVSPLEIINYWLQSGVIVWTEDKQKIIEEWILLNESPQPEAAKKEFQKITGFKYPK
jgi:hypothetical protein